MARVTGSLTHHVLCGRLWDITRQRYPSMHTKRIRKQSRFGPGSRSPARDPAVWSVHPELRCTLRGCGHGKACQTFKGCILCNGHNVPGKFQILRSRYYVPDVVVVVVKGK